MTPAQIRKLMLADVARSGLTAADAATLGMSPVALNGFDQQERYRIPYFELDGKPNCFYRERYVGPNPPRDKKKNNKEKKYDQPKGAAPRFYLPPLNVEWEVVAADPRQKLAITEGEKKAASACKAGIPCIGLGGIWNWRRSSDHKSIPDFDGIVWEGRAVEICCDHDPKETTRADVQRAAASLAAELTRRGATVRIVQMPPGDDDGKQGLDDFLVANGRAAFEALPREEVEARIHEFNEKHFVALAGNKTVIARPAYDPVTRLERIELYNRSEMGSFYANLPPMKVPNTNGGIRVVPFVDYWMRHPQRRTYEGIVFEPGKDVPEGYFNLWRGFAVEPVEGDCSLYLDLLRDVICSGDEDLYRWVIAWMAQAVQHPGQRTGTAIALRGGQGTGKGTAVTQFGKLWGRHFKPITNNRHLVGNFNYHTIESLIIFADEAVWAGDRAGEGTLKGLVTEETRQIESKGVNAFEIRNHVRLLLASNKDWVVPAGFDERRFCVIDVADIHKQDTTYFGAIVAQMDNGGREALLHHLLHLDISGVDLRKIPVSAALMEQKVLSMTPLETWWLSKLREGTMNTAAQDDKKTGWYVFATTLHEEFIEDSRKRGLSHLLSLESFSISLWNWMPGLGQSKLTFDGKRRRCWTLPSLSECRATFPGEMKFDDDMSDWEWPKGGKY